MGGHAFDVSPEDLRAVLWLCVGTGGALAALEAGPSLVWFHQGRGLMTIAKLLLVAAVPLFWPYRLGILLIVVILGSVGSHMPARFRYYSVIRREVIRSGTGAGLSRLSDDPEPAPPHDEEQASP